MGERFDAIVVGGGIVGCAVALALTRRERRVALVERAQPQIHRGSLGFDLRTVALSEASARFLLDCMQHEPIARRGSEVSDPSLESSAFACSYDRMVVWEITTTSHIEFQAADIERRRLGEIVEHSPLTLELWNACARNERIHACTQAVTSIRSTSALHDVVLDDTRVLQAPLVVAADGANSAVRDACGVELIDNSTGQSALATIVELKSSHLNTAWQVFSAGEPLAFLPLPMRAGRHFASIVWSMADARTAAMRSASRSQLLAELEHWRRSAPTIDGRTLGECIDVDAPLSFPLRQRHATSYLPRPGIVLVGDAAHVVHPLAGQGVNLGLRDARILADELDKQIDKHEHDGSLALRRYETRTRAVNDMALRFMAGIGGLFGAHWGGPLRAASPWWRLLRSSGVQAMNSLPILKRALTREAIGEGWLTL